MQNIDSDLIRGNIDTIILKTMLGGDMYGLDIIKEVENKSNGTYELKQPTLYSCLKRLENQGLISSYWLDSDIGGKRHYYKLTEKGHEELSKKQEEWSRSKFIIDNLLGDFNSEEYRLVKKDDYDKIIEGKTFEYNEGAASPQPEPTNPSETDETETALAESVDENDEASANEETPFNLGEDTFEEVTDEEAQESEAEEIQNAQVDEAEESEAEDTDIADETDLDEVQEPVYFQNEASEINSVQEEMDLTQSLPDQSEKENNILSRLRSQDDEEINTYYGDKQSYINQVNLSEPKQPVQESFDENEYGQKNEVDESVDEFEENIKKLNNFQMLGGDDNKPDSDNERLNYSDYSDIDIFDNEPLERINDEDDEDFYSDKYSIDFDDGEDEKTDAEPESPVTYLTGDKNYLDELNELGTGYQNDFKAADDEFKDVKQTSIFDEKPVTEPEQTDDTPVLDFLNETEAEPAQNSIFEDLESADTAQTETSEPEPAAQNLPEEKDNDEAWKNTFGTVADDEPLTSYTSYNYGDEPTQTFYNNMTSGQTSFDDIIYSSFKSNESFTPTNSNETYKQKLQNLSTYTKNSTENAEGLKKAKDINALKSEFEKEGISVVQYKKEVLDQSQKNYLLINKLNLIKSLILFGGFIFILSAIYLILATTNFKSTTGFSFICFLYGFIPFAVYAVYHLIVYLLSPYRKIPAKYSPGIMFFISAIITVQLLLITYCVNLQMGFYSFAQAGYNHLNWIVPLIISFAPLVSTGIHCALFYSRNFNV